ncbi:unnamed protein product [Effrenium voratum]|nr:unnamed protein product [Effrenium voratum]
MTRLHRKPWLLALPILAVYLASGACFIQSLKHSKYSSIRLRCTGEEVQGRPTISPPYQFYRLACEAAKEAGLEVEQYICNVGEAADKFTKSKEVVDRDAFVAAIKDAMFSQAFTLVLGGKNLGKTLVLKGATCAAENEVQANLTIIDIDMREDPNKPLFSAIFDRIDKKTPSFRKLLAKFAPKLASDFIQFLSRRKTTKTSDLVEQLLSPKVTLRGIISTLLEKQGNRTCLMVDEANLALPGLLDSDHAEATRALQFLVMLTKQEQVASVVLISSELAYPYRLQACGMNLQDVQKIVIANEVPKGEMLNLMVKRWNMSEDLAEQFFAYCGGNIDLCCRGVKNLHELEEDFDPFALIDCPGLPSCAADPDAKKHLRNLVKQGWSPVYDVEMDGAAKLIAGKNVGGIIPRRAIAFDRPKGIWDGKHEYALVPSGTLMRWKIAKELERMGAGSATSQPSAAVWVCQLRSIDGKDFEIVGNAFKITSSVSDVDDLKEAIKQKSPNTVSCDAYQLDIYHQEDGRWVKDAEDSAVDRGKSKAYCYGFTLPAGAAGAT